MPYFCASLSSDFRWEVIVLFVDIDGMVDQYCLNFLFIILVYIQTIYFLKYRSIDNLKVSWIAPFIQLELPKKHFFKVAFKLLYNSSWFQLIYLVQINMYQNCLLEQH
jgi:hypothetical protein